MPAPVEPWATARAPSVARRLDHRQRLLGPLGRHAQGVDLAPEHVALDQEPDEPVVDLLAGVDLMVRRGADGLRLAADGGALLGGGAAGVDVDGVDRPPVLGEAGDAEGGIQPAGEGERQRAAGDCIMHKHATFAAPRKPRRGQRRGRRDAVAGLRRIKEVVALNLHRREHWGPGVGSTATILVCS